jgi:hypothetical protein
MTIDDFIAANPHVEWHTKRRIGGQSGVVGTDATGTTVWAIVLGNHHVSSTAPLVPKNARAAVHNLICIQPGKEFATVGDDQLARRLRTYGVPLGNWVTQKQQEASP